MPVKQKKLNNRAEDHLLTQKNQSDQPQHRKYPQKEGLSLYKKKLDSPRTISILFPMRKKRFISPTAEVTPSIYHIHSRCIDRIFKLSGVEVTPDGQQALVADDGGQARTVFVNIIRDYAEFLGCKVNAFCVMSNHFHILLEVPPKKKGAAVEMSDDLFLQKIKKMYALEYYRDVQQMLERFRKGNHDSAAEELKAKYTRRMYDLSEFMKGVKQRFTQWYNRTHNRTGTLWEGRFRSVLVEGGYAARVVAAYIDLNPLRAGIVSRPENYRWSSYGMASSLKDSANRAWAREGLCRVMELHHSSTASHSPNDLSILWEKQSSQKTSGAEWYRMMLYSDGEEVFSSKPESGIDRYRIRKGITREEVSQVLARGGKLTINEALQCRFRYLTHGLVIGSRDFVNLIFKRTRSYFGEKRTSGARTMNGIQWPDKPDSPYRLYSMRDLKKEVLE